MGAMRHIQEHGRKCGGCSALVFPKGSDTCPKCGSNDLKKIPKTMFVCGCCNYIEMGSEVIPDDYQCPRCCGKANGGKELNSSGFECVTCGSLYIETSVERTMDQGVCETCAKGGR